MASERTAQSEENVKDSAKEFQDLTEPDVKISLLSITDQLSRETVTTDLHHLPSAPSTSSTLSGQNLSSSSRRTEFISQNDATQTTDEGIPQISSSSPLTNSVPPLSESSLNVPVLPPPFLDVTLEEVDAPEQVKDAATKRKSLWFALFLILLVFNILFQSSGPLNKETVHEVPISRAVLLSRGDSVKTALLLELDISVSFIK